MSRRSQKIVGVSLLALLVAMVAAFGPLVRSRVRGTLERYGATAEIGWVLPGFGTVVLEDVVVKHPEAPNAEVRLDRVEIELGTPRGVRVDGGNIVFRAGFNQALGEVAAVRASLAKRTTSSEGSGSSTTLMLSGLSASVGVLAEEKLAVERLSVEREDGALRVMAGKVDVVSGERHAALGDVALELARTETGYEMKRLSAGEGLVEMSLASGAPKEASAPGQSSAAEGRGLGGLRPMIEAARQMIASRLPKGTSVDLAGMRLVLRRHDDVLNLGPALIRAKHADDDVTLEYATPPDGAGRSLAISTTLPRPDETLMVRVEGGPLPLALLGIRDGDFRLQDVEGASLEAHATFGLSVDGATATVDGEVAVKELGVLLSSVASAPIRNVGVSFRGKIAAKVDGSELTVDDAELSVGTVLAKGSLAYKKLPTPKPAANGKTTPAFALRSSFEVPLLPCQSLVDSAPSGLLPTVGGMKMAGSFALKGHANFDTTKLDATYDVEWDSALTCRITEVPPNVDIARFRKPFVRKVVDAKGGVAEIEAGPGTANWTAGALVTPFMETGVITCEDGRFHTHDGFDHEAIRNSIRENLREGRFVRGASTISMQLAKNLYLPREKTLSRKIEEALLTMYLEQQLTKPQIIELYLNVVEFGPMVYGVRQAATHYFRTSPGQLSLSQAFYLASILPAPKVSHFSEGGALSPGWNSHLRMLMKHANKRHRVADEELELGLSETPIFGSPSPARDRSAMSEETEATPIDLENR